MRLNSLCFLRTRITPFFLTSAETARTKMAAVTWLSAIVLALLCPRASSSSPPHAVWFQTQERVQLEIAVACTGDRVVNITSDHFSLACATASGPIVFKFDLRESVNVSQSHCTSAGGKEVCILTKIEPHQFDRLTRGATELASQLTSDWTRWRATDEHGLDALDEYDNDGFEKWDTAAYHAAVAANDLVVVDIDYPWCTKCM